jgi:hypothetical protein
MSFVLAGTYTRVYCIRDPCPGLEDRAPQPQDKLILEPKVPHLRIAKGCIEDFLAERGFKPGERVSKSKQSRVYQIEPLVRP